MKITNEDNMELMKRYPDNYFELAIVDPPYGIERSGQEETFTKNRKHKRKLHIKKDWDSKTPNKYYFKELFRVSKNQIIWGGNYMTEYLKPSSCWLLWDKGFSEDVTFAQFEMAWTSFNSSAKKYDKHPSQQHRIHPTQKPIKLYEWQIMRYAKEGDKILDTHLGSGSIAIACHNLGFDLTACELDKEYYDRAMKRIKEQTAQTTLF